MIRGPKIELLLERYTDTSDDGGGQTRVYQTIRKLKGVLTFLRASETVRIIDKETVFASHQFWCPHQPDIEITEKDRLYRPGTTRYYDIIMVDDVLEKGKLLKIDLQERK